MQQQVMNKQCLNEAEVIARLEQRLGHLHARQRLGIEQEHESDLFSGGASRFHPENWNALGSLIRISLKLVGLYGRAQRNAHTIELLQNTVELPNLPLPLNGLRILHLSDLHVDMSEHIVDRIIDRVQGLNYDLCVLTGDYRFRTHGVNDGVIAGMTELRKHLQGPVHAVLGNHDSIHMLPALEDLGIRLLMNEHTTFSRDGGELSIAGIDDAHFYGVANIEKALADIPWDACTVLLSHTPEVYRHAAHAGVDLMLSGHTHGGQICLPGGYPLVLEARIPRRFGRGPWRYRNLRGYTSVGAGSSVADVRLNCAPEVTVHTLVREDKARRS